MAQVTVVIPNYNGMAYVGPCLDTILKQTFQDYEVLVVENASEDGSREWIKEHYPMVRLLAMERNLGFAGGVNAGILACDSPYVLLLNNDTYVEPTFVEALWNAIAGRPEVFSVSSKMISASNKDLMDDAGDYYTVFGYALAGGKGRRQERYNTSYQVFAACAGAAIYHRETVLSLGLFDEQHFAYLEDIDLGFRALLAGRRNVFEPKAVVYHIGSATSGAKYSDWKVSLAAENSIYLIYKNFPWFLLLFNLPFLCTGFLVKMLYFLAKGYGSTYWKGIQKGFAKCRLNESKSRKMRVSKDNLRYFGRVQGYLLSGLFHKLFR